MIKQRLLTAGPKTVGAQAADEWLIFTDAAFDKVAKTGGLGAVLVSSDGRCVAWSFIFLDEDVCELLGADGKETIVYELDFWLLA